MHAVVVERNQDDRVKHYLFDRYDSGHHELGHFA